jgi:hypothetical protein
MPHSENGNARRKLGDRRLRPRYDIVGDLWGTLETVVPLPVLNVSPGGALIESSVPLQPESMHRLLFTCDGQEVGTQVRVSHVTPVRQPDGERTFLIGVQFVSMHPALAGQIAQWVDDGRNDGAAAPLEA